MNQQIQVDFALLSQHRVLLELSRLVGMVNLLISRSGPIGRRMQYDEIAWQFI
jgi:hypothetical protein